MSGLAVRCPDCHVLVLTGGVDAFGALTSHRAHCVALVASGEREALPIYPQPWQCPVCRGWLNTVGARDFDEVAARIARHRAACEVGQ